MITINEKNLGSILSENKPAIIFCWASWSDKCNALWSVMDKLHDKYQEGVNICHIDVSDISTHEIEYQTMVKLLKIENVPLIIAAENQEIIGRRHIYRSSEFKDIEKVVRKLISNRIEEMEKYFETGKLSIKEIANHEAAIAELKTLIA